VIIKKHNRSTGASAEEIATAYLKRKGFTILERNFRNRFGEIDIIACEKGVLVFVEVKAKVGDQFGSPEEMISPGKLAKVRRMATVYMDGQEQQCRIDVIAVVLDEEGKISRLTHYENVY